MRFCFSSLVALLLCCGYGGLGVVCAWALMLVACCSSGFDYRWWLRPAGDQQERGGGVLQLPPWLRSCSMETSTSTSSRPRRSPTPPALASVPPSSSARYMKAGSAKAHLTRRSVSYCSFVFHSFSRSCTRGVCLNVPTAFD
ncbi:uncharacterized protein LOC125516755 [Triticum urartu]|uniref:uncharacterized protein LOC125516755 n=1 Tax=Triticum urartu TaxID=4572 RepID=UPI002043DD75|nr:uncharacterized protein LOC125516755 [Triticum urartu]